VRNTFDIRSPTSEYSGVFEFEQLTAPENKRLLMTNIAMMSFVYYLINVTNDTHKYFWFRS